ncbi:MAG: FecR family protein [Anaerolineales bacterium]
MKRHNGIKIGIIVLLSLVAIAIIGVLIFVALPTRANIIDFSAKLSEILGVVEVRNSEQDQYNPVNNGFILKKVMQLQTKEESRVRLDLSSGSIIRLGQMTVFSLDPPNPLSNGVLSNIELQVGRVWIVLKGGSLEVNTPRGIASVRGSYMSVWVKSSSDDIIVCCLEGSCTYQNDGGIVYLTTGQKIISSDTNVKPTAQPMDQADMQDWRDNSPESSAIVSQVAPLVVTSTPTSILSIESTPTFPSSISSTSTIMSEAAPVFSSTDEFLATQYASLYPGFDYSQIQKCLSYGYTSEKMLTCLINLVETITPWIVVP